MGQTLKGRGASSGIGAATAIALANEGAAVALIARREDRLKDLAARIEAGGGRAVPVVGDVSDAATARDAVHRAVEAVGRADVLVNSAGVMLNAPVATADVADWQRMIQLDCSA